MTNNTNTILKVSIIGLTCFVLSACGGNRKPAEDAVAANSPDITRPPSIVKNRLPSETVKNPDETISFDEWKKKRDAELAGEAKPTP